MPLTYDSIATVTTTAGQTSVTFNSFSGYTDLRLVMNYLSNTGVAGSSIQFNSDTGANYSEYYVTGTGSAASSGRYTGAVYIQVGWQGWATTTIPNLNIVDIFNYSNTSTAKQVLITESSDRNGSGSVTRAAARWNSTAAITSITITENAGGGLYAAGSTFTLYGIKAA